MRKFLFVLAITFVSGCTGETAELLSYGIVENEVIKIETNTNLVAGEVNIIESWNLIEKTTVIPNELGTEFGIAYKMRTPFFEDLVKVKEVIVFPGQGITNPKTGQSAKSDSEWVEIASNEEKYFSYRLDEPWEAKPGPWVFHVKQGDRVLLELTFHVQQ